MSNLAMRPSQKVEILFRSFLAGFAGYAGYAIGFGILGVLGYTEPMPTVENLQPRLIDFLYLPVIAGLFGLLCAVNYCRHRMNPPKAITG